MARTLYGEWRASNLPTKYPFSEAATLTNPQGDVIPEDTFIDALLHPIGRGPNIRLSQVELEFSRAIFRLGDNASDVIATAEIALFGSDEILTFEDQYGRPAGMMVSTPERLGVFQSWSLGLHQFTAPQTEFAARVCVPTPEQQLRGILLETGEFFAGDVILIGEDGVVLSSETVTQLSKCGLPDLDLEIIRVDIVGDSLFRRRECEPQGSFQTPKFVRTLTFTSGAGTFVSTPGDFGGIVMSVGNDLAEDTILRVRTLSDRIVIEAVGQPIAGDS